MRQVQGHGDVAQSAVDADDALRRCHAVDQRVQRHLGPDAAIGADGLFYCDRSQRLDGTRARQRHAPAGRDQPPSELDPIVDGPELVLARGTVHEHRSRRRVAVDRGRRGARVQPVDQRPGRQIEGARSQQARAVDGMAVRRHADGMVHQKSRRPLVARALGLVGQAVARAVGQPRDQRRLGQALEIDDHVIAFALQALAELLPFRPRLGPPPTVAPPPQGALDHRVDTAHAAQERGEAGLHHPVDARLRVAPADVGHHRHGMHHIAERRELDDEHAHHHRAALSFDVPGRSTVARARALVNARPWRSARRA